MLLSPPDSVGVIRNGTLVRVLIQPVVRSFFASISVEELIKRLI